MLTRSLGPLGVVALLDVVLRAGSWSVPVIALLDEPAHLLTAIIVLRVVPSVRRRSAVLSWTLVGAVVLDLDHLPLYLGHPEFVVDAGRPPTHSIVSVATLACLAVTCRRLRLAAGGLAAGVGLHLVRDVATGPGAPLLWPGVDQSVSVPYGIYFALLALAGVTVAARGGRACWRDDFDGSAF